MEQQRTAAGREGPFQCIFKRRYQGCGAGPAVTRALALYDWNAFVKNASTPTWVPAPDACDPPPRARRLPVPRLRSARVQPR